MNIVEQVATGRKSRKIPAARVAERTGLRTSNLYAIEHGRRSPTADTLERAAAGAGLRLLAVDVEGNPIAADVAEEIAAAPDDETAYRAWLQLNNVLARANPVTQVLLTAVEPRPVNRDWDAALAGLIEWRLRQKHTPLPEWVQRPARTESGRWAPWPDIRVIDADPELVPEPLRRRGVLVEEGELESV